MIRLRASPLLNHRPSTTSHMDFGERSTGEVRLTVPRLTIVRWGYNIYVQFTLSIERLHVPDEDTAGGRRF